MTAVNITGYPFIDGTIEGTFYIPEQIAGWINGISASFGVYNLGFWFGIMIFFGIILKLIFWEENDPG